MRANKLTLIQAVCPLGAGVVTQNVSVNRQEQVLADCSSWDSVVRNGSEIELNHLVWFIEVC